MSEYSFPVETIDLPSGGKLYPEGSPLASGRIDIKYMTAKEEDILTSTNLIQKGTVIDKLMESLIVTKGVSPDHLFTGDMNAVMIASRILAYGKDYPIQVSCDSCNKKVNHVVDLSAMGTTAPTEEPVDGQYTLTLPTGVVITFKLLTRSDEKAITAEVDGMKKFNGSIETDGSTRLKHLITSVNGNTERKVIREFVDNMLVRDIRALRDKIKDVSPDVDFNLDIECSECGASIQARMPMGTNFFWPDLGR